MAHVKPACRVEACKNAPWGDKLTVYNGSKKSSLWLQEEPEGLRLMAQDGYGKMVLVRFFDPEHSNFSVATYRALARLHSEVVAAAMPLAKLSSAQNIGSATSPWVGRLSNRYKRNFPGILAVKFSRDQCWLALQASPAYDPTLSWATLCFSAQATPKGIWQALEQLKAGIEEDNRRMPRYAATRLPA